MSFLSFNALTILASFLAIIVLASAQVNEQLQRCEAAIKQCNNENTDSTGNCDSYCEINSKPGITANCEKLDDVKPENNVDDPDYMVCVCRHNGTVIVGCWGDPHCTSADGNYWHPQPKVQMIAMENRYASEKLPFFRLHTFHRPWSAYATVIREVLFEIYGLKINIESIPDVPEPLRANRPAKVFINGRELADDEFPFLHSKTNRRLGTYEHVKIVRDGYYTNVFTNVGINFKIYSYIFYMYSMNSDLLKNVRGFMGPVVRDGISTNDFVYPNGTSIPVWNYDQVLSWASDLPENQGPGKLGKIQAPKPFEGCQGPGVAAMKRMCKPFLLKKNRSNPFHRCLKQNVALFAKHFDTCKMEVCMGITEAKSENQELLEEGICNYLQDIADGCGNLVPDSWASGTFCDKVPRTNPGNSYGHVNKNNRG